MSNRRGKIFTETFEDAIRRIHEVRSKSGNSNVAEGLSLRIGCSKATIYRAISASRSRAAAKFSRVRICGADDVGF